MLPIVEVARCRYGQTEIFTSTTTLRRPPVSDSALRCCAGSSHACVATSDVADWHHRRYHLGGHCGLLEHLDHVRLKLLKPTIGLCGLGFGVRVLGKYDMESRLAQKRPTMSIWLVQ